MENNFNIIFKDIVMLHFDFDDHIKHRLTPEQLKKREEDEERQIKQFWEGQEMIKKLAAKAKAEKEASGKNNECM